MRLYLKYRRQFEAAAVALEARRQEAMARRAAAAQGACKVLAGEEIALQLPEGGAVEANARKAPQAACDAVAEESIESQAPIGDVGRDVRCGGEGGSEGGREGLRMEEVREGRDRTMEGGRGEEVLDDRSRDGDEWLSAEVKEMVRGRDGEVLDEDRTGDRDGCVSSDGEGWPWDEDGYLRGVRAVG
jgi:hypothetical protein